MESILVADRSRTVRTLVGLALKDLPCPVTGVGSIEELREVLGAGRPDLLVADEAFAEHQGDLGPGEGGVILLVTDLSRRDYWSNRLGIAAHRLELVAKPVTLAALRAAADRLIPRQAQVASAVGIEDIKALVAREVERILGQELREAVARTVQETAERLIRQELDRLLKEAEEQEDIT